VLACSQRIKRSTGLTTKLQALSSCGKKVRRGGDGNLMMQMVMQCAGMGVLVSDLPGCDVGYLSYMGTGQEIESIFIGAVHTTLRQCCKRREMMRMPSRCRQIASLSSGTDTAEIFEPRYMCTTDPITSRASTLAPSLRHPRSSLS
jgi:hypothetical protein